MSKTYINTIIEGGGENDGGLGRIHTATQKTTSNTSF